MKTRFLTNAEISAIANGMSTAASTYEQLAEASPELAAQFKRQAAEATALHDLFFNYPTVEIEVE